MELEETKVRWKVLVLHNSENSVCVGIILALTPLPS